MSILFLGGDKRQITVRNFLQKNNIATDAWYGDVPFDDEVKDMISHSRIIILPLPVSNDGISLNVPYITENRPKLTEIISLTDKNALLIGGKFSPSIKSMLCEKGIRYIDYYESEAFQIKNAVLSAEGAIYTAMNMIDKAIFGSKIAVVGFGRIGKLLSAKLKSLGADITICARKASDIAWGESFGYKCLQIKYIDGKSTLCALSENYDIIFNTVPYWVFDELSASLMPAETLFVDLASPPFGIDEKTVQKYNLNYIKASGIPGKYAPVSAGEIIGQTVMLILEKEGMI